MFTVNFDLLTKGADSGIFQNISCLRLILTEVKQSAKSLKFQNISCLRLMVKASQKYLNNL